ncbi:MAG: HWE histidine kinase domain-containing protein [Devosia sp.]|uniref:HWE histidine kinase domain-containing protein n=1 Tax=Devosia sp. TaxID=1871048 RepID=UPI0033932CB3
MTETTKVDLTNCDREPIHIPGSIQPHGCLIACDATASEVLRHSLNAAEMLGVEGEINGTKLEALLGSANAHDIRNALARAPAGGRAALLFGKTLANGSSFDIAVHRFKGSSIIECEPMGEDAAHPLELARTMIGRIATINSIEKLTKDAARLIQAALGYDRVMIYQFGHDGAGKVVSETKRPDLESFLGQYFPATDIPQQARALYLKNTIRIISDANFERIPVMPVLDASGEPLDLSFAHLRSVSPIHCEYLRNMGVGASMSISIIVDGTLWGLIACHHYDKRTLSMAQRVAAEMFGEFFSLHLNALRRKETLDAAEAAREALDSFLRHAVGVQDINDTLREKLPDFGKLIAADGLAMWLDGQLTTIGSTPPPEAIGVLSGFAETVAEGQIWASNKLSNVVPSAESYADRAAGMLVVPLSQRPRDFLYFFRKELVHTLDWAGNPDKVYETGPLGDRLTPRKSFAIWKETVHLQSAPWTEPERQFAEAARSALVEVILQHSELLADERAKAEVRQRMLNEELNHRVKNILAVIRSLVSLPTDDGETLENYVASLRGRIQALSLAHDQVVRGEGGGALFDLLDAELMPYRGTGDAIDLQGPHVWMDARAFSIMALVLHELSTNAAKYGALSRPEGRLSVRWSIDEAGACRITWLEAGGPPVKPPERRGFGSMLIKRSIPFDLGGESDVDYRPEGVVAQFRLPARFVSLRAPTVAVRQNDAIAATVASNHDLDGKTALIVEDQMLIAIDLEQMLEGAGLSILGTATSPRDALAILARNTPDVAVLDVNLGDGTSETIARHLQEIGVPFIFATGYGDGGIIPDDFSGVPVVRKPYEREVILGQLRNILASPSRQ